MVQLNLVFDFWLLRSQLNFLGPTIPNSPNRHRFPLTHREGAEREPWFRLYQWHGAPALVSYRNKPWPSSFLDGFEKPCSAFPSCRFNTSWHFPVRQRSSGDGGTQHIKHPELQPLKQSPSKTGTYQIYWGFLHKQIQHGKSKTNLQRSLMLEVSNDRPFQAQLNPIRLWRSVLAIQHGKDMDISKYVAIITGE